MGWREESYWTYLPKFVDQPCIYTWLEHIPGRVAQAIWWKKFGQEEREKKVRIRFISGQLTGHLHTGPARHLSQLAAKTEALISPMYIVFLQVKGICRFPTLGLNIRLHLSQLGVLVLGQPGSSAPFNGPQLSELRENCAYRWYLKAWLNYIGSYAMFKAFCLMRSNTIWCVNWVSTRSSQLTTH